MSAHQPWQRYRQPPRKLLQFRLRRGSPSYRHLSSAPDTMQSPALQHTPPLHDWPLQLMLQVAPPQVTCPGQALSAQLMCVSRVAALSSEFWHDGWPLHSIKQPRLSLLQLSLPGQLPAPRQRRSHSSASQRTSLIHAPAAMQRTSHELPPQLMLPEQLLGPEHSTVQLSASRHSTPLEHEPVPLHSTEQGTSGGHFTSSGQGWSSSQVMTQTALLQTPLVHAL